MNIKEFIDDFLAVSNNYDTEKYINKWQETAILNDSSVGRVFRGHQGIKEYFENYFISYNTQTRLLKLDIVSETEAHIEVHFTGDFPEGEIGGTFDFTFENGKIAEAKADLKN